LVTNTYEGINLDTSSSSNHVQDNRLTGNAIGTGVNGFANILQGNTASSNQQGIMFGDHSSGNTVQGNTALDNPDGDVIDLAPDIAPNCANSWRDNCYGSKISFSGCIPDPVCP
jgi:parallel beta-helix repeat protein